MKTTLKENNSNKIKLRKQLRADSWKAIDKYAMIKDGDRVMACLSGGKDSYTMLDILNHFQKYSDIKFEIIAVNLDQKQPGFPEEILPEYLSKLGVPFKIIERDTYSIVKSKIPEGKTTCSLCSRLRRGTLYDTARKLKCNIISLGHHREDILETFFLNLFFSGKIETMPPKYRTDEGDLHVIRPLIFCKEKIISEYAEFMQFPIIPCNLCGSQPLLQRQVIKEMINTWEKKYKNRKAIMLNAMQSVSPTHLLDDTINDFIDC